MMSLISPCSQKATRLCLRPLDLELLLDLVRLRDLCLVEGPATGDPDLVEGPANGGPVLPEVA